MCMKKLLRKEIPHRTHEPESRFVYKETYNTQRKVREKK